MSQESSEERSSSQSSFNSVSDIIDLEPSVGGEKSLRKRSLIYDHFEWENDKKRWKCNYCKRTYTSGIGTLNNHIKRNHPNLSNKENQIKLTAHFPILPAEATPKIEITKDGFEERLIDFIVASDQPFSIVEEEKFQTLMKYLLLNNPDIDVPGRMTIRRKISTLYTNKREELKTLFQRNTSKISFVIDCWTSSNNHAFQGVIASWIDENWIPHDVVLDVTLLSGSHTGKNLAHRFSQVLDEYNLWEKILAITTDNASNMGTLFTEMDKLAEERGSNFKSKDCRVRCMAHVLNLACQNVLKSIDSGYEQGEDEEVEQENVVLASNFLDIVKKIRKIVVGIRSSPQRTETFEGQCRLCSFDPRKLTRDIRTRWNSTLDMLERAQEMRKPLEMTITANEFLFQFKLTDDEWLGAGQIIELLKPFRDATLLLSTNREPTLSNTVIVYEILLTHLESYIQTGQANTNYRRQRIQLTSYPQWLINAALSGWNKLKEYYPTADGLTYVAATVLDPRYKDKWYTMVGWEREWINANRRSVKNLWIQEYNKRTEPNLPVIHSPRPVNPIQDQITAQMRSLQRGENSTDELTRYLKEVVVMQEILDVKNSQSEGILGWWKVHQHQYPQLSKMARDFLAVTGTGVPVERLFSSATDLLAPRRQRLSPATINECLCLKNWYKRKIVDAGATNLRTDITNGIQYKVFGELVNDHGEDSEMQGV